MEVEECFLYVAYRKQAGLDSIVGDTRIRPVTTVIKRACMHRPHLEGELYKRVRVDFDPLEKQMCYVACALFDKKDGGFILADEPKFTGVFENEEEADKHKVFITNGGYRHHNDGKDKFKSCRIEMSIITKE